MNANDMFKLILSGQINTILKNSGYQKRGNTFFIKNNGNFGIINFQKSTSSTKDEIMFAINLGIVSKRIYDNFSFEDGDMTPAILNCHWRTRLESSNISNQWWKIDNTKNLELLELELSTKIVDNGIPQIELLIKDESLRNLWLTGKSPALTNFERLLYLLPLLKDLGPIEKIDSTIDELVGVSKNHPTYQRALFYIDKFFPNHMKKNTKN